jgi:hypothetical protein
MTSCAYRAVTVSGAPFQGTSATCTYRVRGSYNPVAPEGPTVWADPVSLAATSGISVDFSSSGYLDVSVPLVRSLSGDGDRSPPGCPIRQSKDRRMCAPPLGLSQLTAAFIAFLCPGIPHMLSLA